jgi:outer membrane biosynthesis protein TonB
MTRIFAPSTPDSFFRRDAIAAALLVIHVVAVGLLMAPPVEETSREELLVRLVVFLVPPDDPEPREASEGEAAWKTGAADGTGAAGGTMQPTDGPVIERRGDIPTLSASAPEMSRFDNAEEDALTVLEVDSAVVRDPTSAAPEYPAHLLNNGVEGLAEVRYVVDTLGFVDTLSYRVLKASHIDFAVAVRRALPNMRFSPALQGGRRVRQLVEQTFRFRITPRTDTTIPPNHVAAPPLAPRP